MQTFSRKVLSIMWTSIENYAGGLLDRVDSYIFSGALAYSYIKAFMPLYGV